MEVQTNKRMKMYLFFIKAIFVVILLCNLTLSVYSGGFFHTSLFSILVIIFWVYGVLCALGYFKKAVTDPDADGVIEYEIKIPYTQVLIVRVVQLAYSLIIAMDKTRFINFIILVALDVMYTVFMLVYKASYYFISEPLEINDTEERYAVRESK